MAESKWAPELDPETPLAEAARVVLGLRLTALRSHVPPLLAVELEDVEHVHRFRVAARRLGTALNHFSPLVPKKLEKSLRKSVKSMRRAAGRARDWDVFLLDLRARREGAERAQAPGFDFLSGYSQGERHAAQESLVSTVRDKGTGTLDDFRDRVLDAVQQPVPPAVPGTIGELALAVVPGLLTSFEESVGSGPHGTGHLHSVRIEGKRLRYSMELFGGCCSPALRDDWYPAIERLQEILGRVNDCDGTVRRLRVVRDTLKATDEQEWKRVKAGLNAFLKVHRQELTQQRSAFSDWWRDWRRFRSEHSVDELFPRGL